jgi:hypothetical protein
MALAEILVVKLGSRLGKILLKSYLRDPAEAIGDDLLEVAKGKIESLLDRREAKRQFERIGERIAIQLEPLFAHEFQRVETSVEAVVIELAKALDGRISAEFFLSRDLDPVRLTLAFQQAHTLSSGQFTEAERELYDRVLAEAVRYIVEVAADLPGFEAAYVTQSLSRLSQINVSVEETARAVTRIEGLVARQGGDRLNQQYETDYRLAIGRNLDFIELFGADLTPESRRRSLSVAYVSLNLHSLRAGDREDFLRVEAVLQGLKPGTGRLLIRGEAGSGKTTLFRWAAIEAAAITEWEEARGLIARVSPISRPQNSDPLPDDWRSKVPFFIRLRECSDGRLPSPEDFPDSIAREIGRPPASWVLSVLRSGRGLLLLDGVDEIPKLNRERVKLQLEAIVSSYPSNYFLITTRPEAVPVDWLRELQFREAWVREMSEADQSRFIDKWHNSVAVELNRLGRKGREGEDLRSLSVELKQKLRDNPAMARLAVNPLLCAMICALHRERNQNLPRSLADLCESLCSLLLQRRDEERGVSKFPHSYSLLTYPQKRAVVRELAHAMVVNWESSITYERAQGKIAEALRLFPDRSEEEAKEVCIGLVERSGMLKEVKPGYLDFIHNTFKEYLAGDRLADSGDSGLLARQALYGAWQRVVLFAMTTSRMDFASEVIKRLLDVENFSVDASGVEDPRRSRLLLAMRCRSVALFVAPDLEKRLEEAAREIQPPRNPAEAEAFASLGNQAIEFLWRRDGVDAKDAAACVRSLRLIGTPEARKVLKAYLQDRKPEVILELAQIFDPLLIRFYREELLRGEKLPLGVLSQIRDLSALSRFFTQAEHVQAINLGGSSIADLGPLVLLPNLRILSIANSCVEDLAPLQKLQHLEELDISGTRVSNIASLAKLKSLRRLDLSGTAVTDIAPLALLVNLEEIDMAHTRVRDVSPLAKLPRLRSVNVRFSDVRNLQLLVNVQEVIGPS